MFKCTLNKEYFLFTFDLSSPLIRLRTSVSKKQPILSLMGNRNLLILKNKTLSLDSCVVTCFSFFMVLLGWPGSWWIDGNSPESYGQGLSTCLVRTLRNEGSTPGYEEVSSEITQ
jgi:hypothetical protein